MKVLVIPMNPSDQSTLLAKDWSKEWKIYISDLSSKKTKPGFRQIQYFIHVLTLGLRINFDMILCMELPQAFIGAILKLIKRKPLVTYVIDDIVNLRLAREPNFVFRKILNLVQKIGAKLSNIIFTVHSKQKNWLKELGAKNVYPIMYGIKLEDYKQVPPAPNPKNNEKMIVQYSGGFYPHHGVHLLLESIELVLKKSPKIEFRIVGASSEELRGKYSQRNVKFIDFMPKKEYIKCLSEADILVCPPDPPFPNVSIVTNKFMEYAAVGRPIIGTRIGAIPDILLEWEAGVPVNLTAKSMSEAIIFLLENPNLREKYGNNARKLAFSEFDWEKNSKKIQKIIESYMD
ncbi:MAG: glycosyltransferase family 4 protein [Candidatus Ranarchaeia archaeon]